MISERQLARGFQNFWREVTPLLNPHFVALFNEVYCHRIELRDGSIAPEVPSNEDSDRSVVAELSFQLAKMAHEGSIPLSDACTDTQLVSKAENVALTLIQEYEGFQSRPRPNLSDVDRAESALLVGNYAKFLSSLSDRVDSDVEFSPAIPGAGFVGSCIADLSVSETLFEIKTVNRNIAGKDIRQLLVYLGLQAATGRRRWSEAGFFNPRRALFYKFSIDRVIPLLSGGRLASEVFIEMVEYFGARDLQVESIF